MIDGDMKAIYYVKDGKRWPCLVIEETDAFDIIQEKLELEILIRDRVRDAIEEYY